MERALATAAVGCHALIVDAPGAHPRYQTCAAIPRVGAGELLVQVEATGINPIDLKRAQGYGRRLLRLKGAATFPLTLGNDFVGRVLDVGPQAGHWIVGQRVMGVQPMGRPGTHASHLRVRSELTRAAPEVDAWPMLGALPYTYTTMRLALAAAGLHRGHAQGRTALVHGASGGLGRLALQTLAHWGVQVSAVCSSAHVDACKADGAVHVIDRTQPHWRELAGGFDLTLNFAHWDDEAWVVSKLRAGALGHASTVHPLLANFDRLGWWGGLWQTRRERQQMQRAARQAAGEQCRYAWVVFKPVPSYLDDLCVDIQVRGLQLPVRHLLPLAQGAQAFALAESGGAARTILLPTLEGQTP